MPLHGADANNRHMCAFAGSSTYEYSQPLTFLMVNGYKACLDKDLIYFYLWNYYLFSYSCLFNYFYS